MATMNHCLERSPLLLLAVVGVALGACQRPLSSGAPAHAQPPRSLAEVLTLYESFNTYQDEATLSETTERGDGLPSPGEDDESHARFWFRRPDHLRLEWTFDTGWDQGNKHLLVSGAEEIRSVKESSVE